MAALREYSIAHYAVPEFMGRAVSEAKYLPLLFAPPTLIFLAVLFLAGNLTSLPAGQVVFSKFVPILYIEITFTLAVGAAILAAVFGGRRYWKAMRTFSAASAGEPAAKRFMPTLVDIFKHARFRQCEGERVGTRESHKAHLHRSHLVIFYGFLGLVVTTASVAIGIYGFGYLTPWPFWHPVKILGNVSGVAVLAACGVFVYRRLRDKEKAGKSTYSDWLLLGLLGLTTMTGFLSEIFRSADLPFLAYPTYFIHLVLIFFLLVYIPYSKFAHLTYRFVAMLYAAGIGPSGNSPARENL
jgi:quinone-modifying oxidoreductase subunit QmoC